jgi:hypothetical protein
MAKRHRATPSLLALVSQFAGKTTAPVAKVERGRESGESTLAQTTVPGSGGAAVIRVDTERARRFARTDHRHRSCLAKSC